jgi:hypothetical protein
MYGVPSLGEDYANVLAGMPGMATNPVAAYFAQYGANNQAAAPSVAPTTTPGGVGGSGGGPASQQNLGFNLPTLNLALGGLQTIGNLWGAWQANKLAKQQFGLQRNLANANLANQIQSYNTTLEDRIRSRYFTQGGTSADADAYLSSHRLNKTTV